MVQNGFEILEGVTCFDSPLLTRRAFHYLFGTMFERIRDSSLLKALFLGSLYPSSVVSIYFLSHVLFAQFATKGRLLVEL